MSDHLYLDCSCGHFSHVARLSRMDDEVYLEVGLPEVGFWRRLWIGLAYIFLARRSPYGDLAEIIFERETAAQAVAFLADAFLEPPQESSDE